MHIMIVYPYYLHKGDSGGSRWNQFAKYWSQAGHKITVVAGMVHCLSGKKWPQYRGKYFVTEHERPGVTVKRCHVSNAYNKSSVGRVWAYLTFVVNSVLVGLFMERPDVIICSSPPLTVGLTGAILSKLKHIPMVFEIRDFWPDGLVEMGFLKNKWLIKMSYWLERLSYKSANWINVLTPAFEKALIEKKNIKPDKISVIPNGADLDIIKPGPKDNWVREQLNLEGKFVVTYVGAHGAANALMQLLEAANILKKKMPDVQIMLVGDGVEKPELIKAAEALELENVTFVDSVPKSQIADYINASDVCTAVLKKADIFKTVYPNKVFDYMSVAKPTIVAIDGVARKLIEDANAGLYVEPENPQAFVEAVLKLQDNAGLCRQYGENGLLFVKENFARDVLADKYLNIVVNKVVAGKKERALE